MSARPAVPVLLAACLIAACTSSPENTTVETAAPTSAPAPASDRPSATSPTPTAAPSTPDGSAERSRIRLQPPRGGGSFLVRGVYPHVDSPCRGFEQPRLLARYPGELSVRRAEDGTLSILVTLTFERYLQGIAEVPTSWPMAALEAQAVAARSYALSRTGWTDTSTSLDAPICATTACQVFRGIPVPAEPGIERWHAAVRRTRGLMLVYGGRPADTVYFSTSNGRTYGNEDVFGSSPLPYLRPRIEQHDGASPTSRWSTSIPFDDLTTMLVVADAWPRGSRIGRVRVTGGSVTLRGGATTRTYDLDDLRTAINTWAPCALPGVYPRNELPLTIPSRWSTMSSSSEALFVQGRGWGHGAGMVQWGAYGKAKRGWSSTEILSFYYGGLEPERYPEPGVIDVEVATGLTRLRILPSAAGARVGGRRIGARTVTVEGGAQLTVTSETPDGATSGRPDDA